MTATDPVTAPTEDSSVTDMRVQPELCLVRPTATTSTDLLRQIAALAVDAGYAEPTFGQALVDREASFPTGLPTPTPIAIPHTDVQHVRRPALAAALLEQPVEFGEMGGTPDKVVPTRLVIALLVTDPTAQVPLLGQVLQAAQTDAWPDWDGVTTPDDLAAAVNRAMGIPDASA